MRIPGIAGSACSSEMVNRSSKSGCQVLLLFEPLHGLWKAANLPSTIRASLKRYGYRIVEVADHEFHILLKPMALRTDILKSFEIPNDFVLKQKFHVHRMDATQSRVHCTALKTAPYTAFAKKFPILKDR